MKVCARCHIEKEDSDFRTQRYKERIYLRSYCKVCDKLYQRERARKLGVPAQSRKIISIPDVKVCTRCKVEKAKEEFRVRVDKRFKPSFTYLNNTCLKCDAEKANIRFKQERATPAGREKHNQWAREFHKRHRDKCIRYMREKRKTPEYKAYMKEYREKNKERIYRQEVITKWRYAEKHKIAITDEYIIGLIKSNDHLTREEILENPELIEIRRVRVLMKRLKKIIQDHERHYSTEKSSIRTAKQTGRRKQ